MAKNKRSSSATSVVWILSLLVAAITTSAAPTETKSHDAQIPIPKVTCNNPKSSLLQVAWNLQGYPKEKLTSVEILARDPYSHDKFTCTNNNYYDGLCTISGLSPSTTYNVTVEVCSENGCGTPVALSYTTLPRSRFYFGTIFVIFVFIMLIAFIAFNFDVIHEAVGPCWLKVRSRFSRRYSVRGSPEVEPVLAAESPSTPTDGQMISNTNGACSDAAGIIPEALHESAEYASAPILDITSQRPKSRDFEMKTFNRQGSSSGGSRENSPDIIQSASKSLE